MPESTIGQSILSTLGSIAGISGRRAQDGLTAAQAEEVALKNKASRQILQDDEDATMLGEFEDRGYLTVDPASGKITVDIEKLAADPTALSRLMNPEASKFFSTKTADGKAPVTIAGVKMLPGELSKGPSPLEGQTGPISLLTPQGTPQDVKSPNRYVIQLRTQDGRVVPATQNASAAADDSLITLDQDQLTNIVNGRLSRMKARGALDNNVTLTKMNLAYQEAADAALQAKLMDMGPDDITDDPAAARSLYDLIGNAKGEELNEIARDRGLDPDKLRAEAEKKWVEDQIAIRKKIPLNTEDMTAYESTKELLTQQVERTAKAMADRAASKNSIRDAVRAENDRIGAPTLLQSKGKDQIDYKLEKEHAAAVAALAGLKRPEMKALSSGAPLPKFEWTEDNLRESVRGTIDEMPSAEQTAMLTKYAKDQGVQKPQDLAKIPDRNDALAIAWVIASNARGATPDKKVDIFNQLANYARTGDSKRSPIDATVDISNARVNQQQVINQGRQVDAAIANNDVDNAIARSRLYLDGLKFQHEVGKDEVAIAKDMDTAANKVGESMEKIYAGTIGPDNKFLKTGPTRDAMIAWKKLRRDNEQLPLGSPQQIATGKAYLEGFFQMAAAQTQVPGTAQWYDFPKQIANLFFREDAMVNMSPLINTARIEYKNGKPERISFTEHAGTGKEMEAVVGADEFDRFTGGEDFTTFVNAVHSQQAVNLLQASNLPITPDNMEQAIKEVRKATGMDK